MLAIFYSEQLFVETPKIVVKTRLMALSNNRASRTGKNKCLKSLNIRKLLKKEIQTGVKKSAMACFSQIYLVKSGVFCY